MLSRVLQGTGCYVIQTDTSNVHSEFVITAEWPTLTRDVAMLCQLTGVISVIFCWNKIAMLNHGDCAKSDKYIMEV